MFCRKQHQILIIFLGIMAIFICTKAYGSQLAMEDIDLFYPEKINEETCFPCHREKNLETNEGILSSRAYCLDCHSEPETTKKVQEQEISLQVPQEAFESDPHEHIACIQCHTDVASSPHQAEKEIACVDCHPVHSESSTHPPHSRVSCQSCHFAGDNLKLDPAEDKVLFSRFTAEDKAVSMADHALTDLEDKTFCQKCHYPDNELGAAATVLPGKSALCMPCHNAPLSVGSAHGLYWGPLLIAVAGFLAMFSLWFKGSFGQKPQDLHQKVVHILESFWKVLFTRRVSRTLKVILVDILLQRRILEQGVQRWLIHSLIFYGFIGRFGLSLFTVIIYNIWPESSLAEILVNKNHPFVAVFNDFMGLCILAGIIWAGTLRFFVRPVHMQTKEQDALALLIIGCLVIVGFILEGMRILVTQVPQDIAVYSFAGYFISGILNLFDRTWQSAFAVFWYLHVALWAAFIIYLPFGKLKHVIITPLNLILSEEQEQ